MSDAQFSAPDLSTKELLLCLKEIGCDVTTEDIKKPQPETVRLLFVHFLEVLTGTTREELAQPSMDAIDVLEYPELHEESVGEINLLRALTELAGTVGVPDFSISDLLKPTHKRVVKIFSSLINFAKFREEKIARYAQMTAETDVLIEERNRVLDERDAARADVEAVVAQREAEEAQVKALRAANEELLAKASMLNRKQAELRQDNAKTKTYLGSVNENISNTAFSLSVARQDTAALRSQIVQSPEKLRRSVAHMEESVGSTKAAIAELNERVAQLAVRGEQLATVERDIDGLVELLEGVEEAQAKAKAMLKDVKAHKESGERWEAEVKELVHKEAHLQRQIENAEEKMTRMGAQHDMKRETARAELERVRADKLAVQKERAAAQAKVEQQHKLIKEVEAKMLAAKRAHEAEMQRMQQCQSEVMQQVVSWHAALFAEMHAQA